MSELLNPGRYRGHITASKVDKSRNGCIQFVARLVLRECFDEGTHVWEKLDLAGEITAYLMLTKLSGDLNVHQVEALRDTLGWNGCSLGDLHSADWTGRELDAIVEQERDDEGGLRLVVQWLNPVGGLRPTPPDVLGELCAQWKRLAGPDAGPV